MHSQGNQPSPRPDICDIGNPDSIGLVDIEPALEKIRIDELAMVRIHCIYDYISRQSVESQVFHAPTHGSFAHRISLCIEILKNTRTTVIAITLRMELGGFLEKLFLME